jgi:hypothetical protein
MSVQSPAPYRTHAGDPDADRDSVIALWRGNLGEAGRHAGKFDWFYLACPFGRPLLQLLQHHPTGRIGCCAAGPRRMLWQGRELRAGVLVDMAVDARHRTLGPALLLQESLKAGAAGRFDLLYGFPNRKSLPVVRRLGYQVLGQMPRYSRVLRNAPYLARHLPAVLAHPLGWLLDRLQHARDRLRTLGDRRLHAAWADQADPRMDALWEASPHGNGMLAVRDTTFLRWRFDHSPLARTRYLLLMAAPGAPLLAWFACQTTPAGLHVRDFWSHDAIRGIDRALVHALVRAARRENHAAVTAEYAAPGKRLAGWQQAGFSKRGSRPVVGIWLGGAEGGAMLAAEWHLTAADEDE